MRVERCIGLWLYPWFVKSHFYCYAVQQNSTSESPHPPPQSPMTYLALIRFLALLTMSVSVSSHGAGLKSNQNWPVTPIKCVPLLHHHYSLLGSWLGRLVTTFSSGGMHSTFQHCESQPMWFELSVEYQLDFSVFCDSSIWCFSGIGYYCQVLEGNQEHWQQPVMFGGWCIGFHQPLTQKKRQPILGTEYFLWQCVVSNQEIYFLLSSFYTFLQN